MNFLGKSVRNQCSKTCQYELEILVFSVLEIRVHSVAEPYSAIISL